MLAAYVFIEIAQRVHLLINNNRVASAPYSSKVSTSTSLIYTTFLSENDVIEITTTSSNLLLEDSGISIFSI